jgi:hypothetical protein
MTSLLYLASKSFTEFSASVTGLAKYVVSGFSVLDPRKCEYLKDYSLYFEHAYMTTYLASWDIRGDAGNIRHHCPGRVERDASCLRKWPARYSHFLGSSTEKITLYNGSQDVRASVLLLWISFLLNFLLWVKIAVAVFSFFLRFGTHSCYLSWRRSTFFDKIIVSYFHLSLKFFVNKILD